MSKKAAAWTIALTGILLPFVANIAGGLTTGFPPFQYFEPEAAIFISALNILIIGAAVISYLLLCRIQLIAIRLFPTVTVFLLLIWIHSLIDMSKSPETPLVFPIISMSAAFMIGFLTILVWFPYSLCQKKFKPKMTADQNQEETTAAAPTAAPKHLSLWIIAITGIMLPLAANITGNIALHRQALDSNEIFLIIVCNGVVTMAALGITWLLKLRYQIWCYVPTAAGYAFLFYYHIFHDDRSALAVIFISLFSVFLIYGLMILIISGAWLAKFFSHAPDSPQSMQ